MTRIKICGLSLPEHVQWANEVLVDYVGFVFASSRRMVSEEQAIELSALVDPRIQVVGVFVDAPLGRIVSLSDKQVINLIQLHGNESAEYIHEIRRLTNLDVIKALRSPSVDDLQSPSAEAADYLLLDSAQPGSGRCFDWTVAKACSKPFFLAGGLGAHNLEDAIACCHPFAVDLSSAVEVSGRKDRFLMHQAVACAHRL